MEILTKEQPEPSIKSATVDVPYAFEQINPKEIETLKYLGLTNSLYDDEIIGKVKEIVEFIGDKNLQEIDLKLGNPYNMTQLDKIYSYIRLMKQSVDLQTKEALLQNERDKYDTI